MSVRHLVSLIVAFAVSVAWGSTHAQEANRPIRAAGVGTIDGPPKQPVDCRLQFRIRNSGKQPATIKRAEVLMIFSSGGWSYSQGETIARDGTFLGDSPTLAPGEERAYNWTGQEGCPPLYWLLAVRVSLPGRPDYDDMIAIPYHRPGFANPAPCASPGRSSSPCRNPSRSWT